MVISLSCPGHPTVYYSCCLWVEQAGSTAFQGGFLYPLSGLGNFAGQPPGDGPDSLPKTAEWGRLSSPGSSPPGEPDPDLLANSITLTPGTITVSLEDGRLCVYAHGSGIAAGTGGVRFCPKTAPVGGRGAAECTPVLRDVLIVPAVLP